MWRTIYTTVSELSESVRTLDMATIFWITSRILFPLNDDQEIQTWHQFLWKNHTLPYKSVQYTCCHVVSYYLISHYIILHYITYILLHRVFLHSLVLRLRKFYYKIFYILESIVCHSNGTIPSSMESRN